MLMSDTYDKALAIIRFDIKIPDSIEDNIADMEENIPRMKWMYRNNIDRKKISEWLDIMVDGGSLKAAETVVELRFNKNEAGDTGSVYREITKGDI